MNGKITFPLSLVLLLMTPAWASMYKCTDTGGRVTYQQEPSENISDSATQTELQKDISKEPFPKTAENEKNLEYFIMSEDFRILVDGCQKNNAPFAKMISKYYQQFLQTGEDRIEKGREIADRGLTGMPHSAIQRTQRKKKFDRRDKIQKWIEVVCPWHVIEVRSNYAVCRSN